MAEPAEETAVEPASGSGKTTKILVIVGICVTGLAAGGGLYWAGVIPGMQEPEEVVEVPPDVNHVLALDPLVVNLSNEGEMRYVRIQLTFGLASEDPESKGEEQMVFMPKLKDFLLTTLGKWKLEDLVSPVAKQKLKSELLSGVRELVPEEFGQVLEVYVTELIVQ